MMVNTNNSYSWKLQFAPMNHFKTLTHAQFTAELHNLVDQHLQQAISVYQNLSSDVLNKASSAGGWSITQCLEHLNTYYRYYLPLLSNHPFKTVSEVKRGWLGDYFIKMMDPDRKVTKYKASKGHLPSARIDAHQVVAEFIRHQEEMFQLLSTADKLDLNGIRIPTSINKFIRLRMGDILIFLVIHDERHIRQANCNVTYLNTSH
jgi:hypothetical protein